MSAIHNKIHSTRQYLHHLLTAKRGGHGVHSPFAFTLCEEVFYNVSSFYDFQKLDGIRKELLKNERVLKITDHGAGSRILNNTERKVSDIARHGISNKKQSELLYRLINFSGYKNCIELGASLGLNALYLSLATGNGNVHSIEGSSELCAFAHDLAYEEKRHNLHFESGTFDTVLPVLLAQIPNIDFAYVDGNHSYDATLRYFDLLIQKLNPDGVIVFDDIYWSKGMTAAWKKIIADERVKLSIDLFHMGMVFIKPEFKEKTTLRLFI